MSGVKRYLLLDESGHNDHWMVSQNGDCVRDEGPWVMASEYDRMRDNCLRVLASDSEATVRAAGLNARVQTLEEILLENDGLLEVMAEDLNPICASVIDQWRIKIRQALNGSQPAPVAPHSPTFNVLHALESQIPDEVKP